MSESIWREPAEESRDLYPGFVVHDERRGGAILTEKGNTAPWWFIVDVVHAGWPFATEEFGMTEDVKETTSSFLAQLLGLGGEFARLLLVLADAERRETEREEAKSAAHFAKVEHPNNVCECGIPPEPAWWEDDATKQPVIDQLRRCLASLTNEFTNHQSTTSQGGSSE